MIDLGSRRQGRTIRQIAEAVRARGGRALVVGGCVRDHLLERNLRDIDIEVLGLDLQKLESILQPFGRTHRSGRQYPVIRLPGLMVDFTVAERTDLDFAEAARRRDLTINSMGIDPLNEELLDPHSGRADLERRILRATDPNRFGTDPLRALRVTRMAAQFEMQPDPELIELCAALDLSQVAPERIFGEFSKLLLEAPRPSQGLDCLKRTGLLPHFPELSSLQGVPQDPQWHPEGDVWIHTGLAVDRAADLRQASDEDAPLMWSVLCHDLGKPSCTVWEGGRIRSPGHDIRGEKVSRDWLSRLLAPKALTREVSALVRHHLAPALFVANGAGPRGYRRLARNLAKAGVHMALLERVARADHLGRTAPGAKANRFAAGESFLKQAAELAVEHRGPPDVVQGRHLLARGLEPGKQFGQILDRCRALQDATGETDPEVILDRVL